MRTYEEAEELAHSGAEITLGLRSILGIFFALALVCGVFFGFGYSLGRGNPGRSSAPVQLTSPSPEAETPLPVKTVVEEPATLPITDAPARKPSGAILETVSAASQQPTTPTAASETKVLAARPAAPAPTPIAAAVPTNMPPTSAELSAAIPAAPIAGAPIMVQIAAVSRRQDADVLVSALGKLGYRASTRSAPMDTLLHVQIGPFSTRDEAKAMRTKLLNDGYNAILK
jgi:cell division septation protein DedD